MAQIAALIAEANSRLAAATRTRVPRRVLDGPRKELAAVDESVQKAGAAMRADDYLAARMALQGVKRESKKRCRRFLRPHCNLRDGGGRLTL